MILKLLASDVKKDNEDIRYYTAYKITTKEIKTSKKTKTVPLHATQALLGRAGIAPTHSRPRN
jgi:hypothetical protein